LAAAFFGATHNYCTDPGVAWSTFDSGETQVTNQWLRGELNWPATQADHTEISFIKVFFTSRGNADASRQTVIANAKVRLWHNNGHHGWVGPVSGPKRTLMLALTNVRFRG
jgi:hypothetical protein